MSERIRPIEQMLELSEEEAMSPEHLDSQVQKAQEQLMLLKRQSEQIEKQKRELEELSRRQEELERGRAEMTDKLSRSLVILEREGYDSQKKLEQIRVDPRKLYPTSAAPRSDRAQELEPGRAAEGVEPRAEHGGRCPDGIQPATEPPRSREQRSIDRSGFAGRRAEGLSGLGGGKTFAQWVQIGFAVTLPLIIFGLIALLIFFWMAAKGQ